MTLSSFLKNNRSGKPHYVLLGHPVEHSWSPLMHNTALEYHNLDARYYAIDLQTKELGKLASYLNKNAFLGANVTIPYKQVISDYLDTIDSVAQSIGAVNTIICTDGRLCGTNTDIYGFSAPLQEYSHTLEGGRAIIFGTGGASKAIVAALVEIGMQELYLVSRSPQKIRSFENEEIVRVISYSEWAAYAGPASLIVNATPLGMTPNTDASPVRSAEQHLLSGSICYDIVYNPAETKFLKQAISAGAATIGGMEMLIQQGSRSFEYWTGYSFPIDNVRNLLYDKLSS